MSGLTSDLSRKDKLGLQLLNACYFGNTAYVKKLLENPAVPADWSGG